MSFFKTLFSSCTSQKNDDNHVCKTFHDWPNLPIFLKQRVIFEMDSATRSNLADCSRSDYRVVKETEREFMNSSSSDGSTSTSSSCDTEIDDVTFEDWNRLPNELKHLTISKMDYFTRLELSRCSKSDYQRVNEVKMSMFSMRIKKSSQKHVELSMLFDSEADDCLHLRFVEKDGDDGKCYLSIGSGHYSELEWEQGEEVHKAENYEIVAFNTITKFLKLCDFKVNRLIIQMDSPVLQYIFEKTIKSVKEFQINTYYYNPQYIIWWLGKVGNLKSLGVIPYNGLSKEKSISEVAMKIASKTCHNIYFSYLADPNFSEEEFLQSNATNIHVNVNQRSLITTRTLNEFIKRWISGEGVVGFTKLWAYTGRKFAVEFERHVLLKGIGAIEWDYTFRRKRQAFCNLFSQFFHGDDDDILQINNKKGDMTATIQFDKKKILFLVTGEVKDGRMCYRLPKLLMPF